MCLCPLFDKRYSNPLKLHAILLSVFLFVGLSAAYAGENGDFTDKIKVAFTYKIIQFIELPDDTGSKSSGFVTICVIADKQLDRLFADLEGKEINGDEVKVLFLKQSPKSSDQCGILYIGNSEQVRLPQILQQIASLNKMLTVSDIDQFARRGGMVELKIDEKAVKMEINVSNVTHVGIRISSKLLEVANIVQRD
ncbi:MAG: YfiR family protein [Methylococcaceae bacterium]